jgi:hypothetical protein
MLRNATEGVPYSIPALEGTPSVAFRRRFELCRSKKSWNFLTSPYSNRYALCGSRVSSVLAILGGRASVGRGRFETGISSVALARSCIERRINGGCFPS